MNTATGLVVIGVLIVLGLAVPLLLLRRRRGEIRLKLTGRTVTFRGPSAPENAMYRLLATGEPTVSIDIGYGWQTMSRQAAISLLADEYWIKPAG